MLTPVVTSKLVQGGCGVGHGVGGHGTILAPVINSQVVCKAGAGEGPPGALQPCALTSAAHSHPGDRV
jgi:hypothetical protein